MKNIVNKLLIIVCFFWIESARSQVDSNTLHLNYSSGKSLLLAENLNLLAEYYNIEIAQAQIDQAKLWNNPLFVWNAEMYSIAKNQYFGFNNQKLIQLEYAFSISGKRVNAIRQANLNREMAELAFSDVIRGIVAEYSANYLSLNALKEKEAIFQLILSQFEDVIELSTIKLSLGVNSESDLVRLQTEFLALQSLLAGIKNEIFLIESHLKTMLSLSPQTKLETQKINYVFPEKINIQLLIDSARINRPDFLIAEKNLVLNDMKYKGQKKEAYPMINLGYQPLDGGSNYVRPYSGMVFEMSLPIFNRNQGNIRAAKVGVEQGKYTFEYAKVELENQVAASYLQHINSKSIYMQYTDQMLQRMNELSMNAKMNFEKRNISLIEYIDHQRAYIDHQMNWIDANSNYYQSINQIYFTVGKEIAF